MRGAGLINSSPEERTGSLFEDQVAELNDDILECSDFASRREENEKQIRQKFILRFFSTNEKPKNYFLINGRGFALKH